MNSYYRFGPAIQQDNRFCDHRSLRPSLIKAIDGELTQTDSLDRFVQKISALFMPSIW